MSGFRCMTNQQIVEKLNATHRSLTDLVANLNEADFMHSANGKWTAGQQLEHIYKSVSPVTLAFRLPKFMLKMAFGKSNRPSRSYDKLVEKYKSKLAAGGVAPTRFVPRLIPFSEREKVTKKVLSQVAKLCSLIKNLSDADLESYIIPHPLLGKLTFREMLYFTAYHAQHHEELTKRNLQL
jgi:DinB superfamily